MFPHKSPLYPLMVIVRCKAGKGLVALVVCNLLTRVSGRFDDPFRLVNTHQQPTNHSGQDPLPGLRCMPLHSGVESPLPQAISIKQVR